MFSLWLERLLRVSLSLLEAEGPASIARFGAGYTLDPATWMGAEVNMTTKIMTFLKKILSIAGFEM